MKNNNLKKIGIIGGAGALASALLYKKLVEAYYNHFGYNNNELPEIVILNYPFGLELLSDRTKTQLILQNSITTLAQCKTTILAIACNSLHGFLDGLTMQNRMLLVHIAEAVIKKAIEAKAKRFLLLGTSTTHNYGVYENKNITCLSVPETDQQIVRAIIEKVLAGTVNQEDADTLIDLAAKTYDRNPFDGIILGCTDLSVIHEKYPITVIKNGRMLITLDSVSILAHELAQLSIA